MCVCMCVGLCAQHHMDGASGSWPLADVLMHTPPHRHTHTHAHSSQCISDITNSVVGRSQPEATILGGETLSSVFAAELGRWHSLCLMTGDR